MMQTEAESAAFLDVLGGGLPAAVLDFNRGGFYLGRDISDLQSLYRDERAPAVLFYCGRILEVLLAVANELYLGESTTSAGPNLRRLSELGVLKGNRADQVEALRQLALDANGTRRPIHWADASCAILLLERLLTWFFVELERGPGLPLLGSSAPRTTLRDPELMRSLALLDAAGDEWQELPHQSPSALLRTPTIAVLYLERALREGAPGHTALFRVAETALGSFGGDVRLRQLLARLRSVRGATGEAIAELEALDRRHPNDPDTLRLLGDVYQEHCRSTEPNQQERILRKALHAYQQAWSRSYETDNYAGVQAALLGLLRGRTQRAELVAQTVVDSYTKRWLALGPQFKFADFDDRVRLAHCALILREGEFARRRYQSAFEQLDATRNRIDATKRQIKALLLALDLPSSPKRFLDGKTVKRRRASAYQLELPILGLVVRQG
jgi:hypothetical protein